MRKKWLLGFVLMMSMVLFMACSSNVEEDMTVEEIQETENDEVEDTEAFEMEEGKGAYRDDVIVSDLRQAVVDVLEDEYLPDAEIPAEILELNIGITEYMYDEIIAEMSMISTYVDTLIIVKAKDGQIEAVEEALRSYQTVFKDNVMEYPNDSGKIQASQMATYGNYVCFVQLGGETTAMEEVGDEEVMTYCEEENRKALEAMEGVLYQ